MFQKFQYYFQTLMLSSPIRLMITILIIMLLTVQWARATSDSSELSAKIAWISWLLEQQELSLSIPSLTWLNRENQPTRLENIRLSIHREQEIPQLIIQANLLNQQKSEKINFTGKIISYNKVLTLLKIQFTLELPILKCRGMIEFNLSEARLKIQQTTLDINATEWYGHPLKLENLRADLQWKNLNNQYLIDINRFDTTEQTLRIQGAGKITVPVASETSQIQHVPTLDLNIQLQQGQVAQIHRYIPDKLLPHTIEWFKNSLLSGTFKTMTIKLKGAVNQLLESNHLQLKTILEKVKLRYEPSWPPIENLTTSLELQGRTITLIAQQGFIYRSKITQATGIIKDITADEPALDFIGELQGTGEDCIQFIKNSPLHQDIDVSEGHLDVSGQVGVQLKINVPFSPAPNTIFTKISLKNSIVRDDAFKIKLTEVTGELYFDGKYLSSNTLHGKLSETPVDFKLSVQPQENHQKLIFISLSSQVDRHFIYEQMYNISTEFEKWRHIYDHFSGSMRLEGNIRIFKTQQPETSYTDIVLHSKMQGMTLDLPQPLLKTAEQSLPFRLHAFVPKVGDTTVRVNFGQAVNTTLNFNPGLTRGTILLGDDKPVDLPENNELQLIGKTEQLSWYAWQHLLFGEQPPEARSKDKFPLPFLIDLKTARLDIFGQLFDEVNIKAQLKDEVWHVSLVGQGINGKIQYDNTQSHPTAHLVFKNLIIPPQDDIKPELNDNETPDTTDPRDLPTMTFHADNLQFGKMFLGNVNIYTYPTARGMFIDLVEAKNNGLNIAARGEWKYQEQQQYTALTVWMDSKNIPVFLQNLGFSHSPISGGTAQIEMDVQWLDTPYRFKLAKLKGKLRFLLTDGLIVDVDPGVGRVIGLFDLTVLPRRITLDFNDIFSKGFAFSDILGEFELNYGLAHTDRVIIQAPAARIEIQGQTDLINKQYNQLVNVFPHVSNTLPIAGALVGGLGVGALAIVIQQLLQNEIEKTVNYQYHVTGSWDKPQIESVSIPSKTPQLPQRLD